MCTVTYIPTEDGVILTSNRDERVSRRNALPPAPHRAANSHLLYPVDQEKGGSWIACRNDGTAAVLLNGAFERHVRLASYKMSRGLLFLDIVKADDPLQFFMHVGLDQIEPFTLVVFRDGGLFECRWDGNQKHVSEHDADTPRIWSSATLYNRECVTRREQLFNRWYESAMNVNQDAILKFHQSAGDEISEPSILLDSDGYRTVSITSMKIKNHRSDVVYRDLRIDQEYKASLPVIDKIDSGLTFRQRWQRFKIRATSWEYWPFDLVYIPVYVYWMWLSVKYRSFFFFSAANPSIENAGFLLESKYKIYQQLPRASYPQTAFCNQGITGHYLTMTVGENFTVNDGIKFPLIMKPDIGQRGIGVRLVKSEEEMIDYATTSRVNFLIQEYIDYPMEAGIFYYRIPGESRGHVSGIVGKELLTIKGDGESTMEELLRRCDRYKLQLPVLLATYGNLLQRVLPDGDEYRLVPYGNHSRGAKFTDEASRITPKLEQAIDSTCQKIPGFYYGRLDIKFNSWEELEEGKAYSIIEVNGAGSEPAHIYDPEHSIFFAWREIIRHLNILGKISSVNAKVNNLRLMTTSEGLKMFRDNKKYLKLLERKD